MRPPRGSVLAKPLLVGFNGTSVAGTGYGIGFGDLLPDHGDYWRAWSALAAGSGWEAGGVKDASLQWDGTQFVLYYSGYDASNVYQIGRATAPKIQGPWTKYASNPVIALGGAGTPDQNAARGPQVVYNAALSPAWKMWYTGYDASNNQTVCFADSTDGVTWTKRGKVLGPGTAGSFSDAGVVAAGQPFLNGSTWYVWIAGLHSYTGTVYPRGGYVTCTDPANIATYSAATALTNYTGTVTVGGKTWQANAPTGLVPDPAGGYHCFVTFYAPTDTSSILEVCSEVHSPDLTSWDLPSSLMFDMNLWTKSMENPSILVAP